MGASKSKAESLNKILNEAAVDVMNRNSSAATTTVKQTNAMTIAGNTGGTVSGIVQINSAKINVSALQSSAVGGQLQSDMAASLTSAIEQNAASIGYSASATKVRSIVENKVHTSITNENLTAIKNSVQSDNSLQIVANTGTDVRFIKQKNEADLIIKMVSSMNADIVNDLTTSGVIDASVKQSTASLIPNLAGMAVVAVVIGGCGGIYFFRSTLLANPYRMGMVVCAILAIVVVIIIIAAASKKDDKKDSGFAPAPVKKQYSGYIGAPVVLNTSRNMRSDIYGWDG